ncbi:MAG: hypothetical protein K8R69_00715 [Deltaproteobacteria bacterium]|nr:hypothetical protein [Deltaproteobacteria bacterium]
MFSTRGLIKFSILVLISCLSVGCTKNGDVCDPNAASGQAKACSDGLICCQSSGTPICNTVEACANQGGGNNECAAFSENLGSRKDLDNNTVVEGIEYDVEVTCVTPTNVCFYDGRDDNTGLVQDFHDPTKMAFQLVDSSADSLDGMIARGAICGNTFSWEEDAKSIPLDRVEVGQWIFHDEKNFSYQSTVYDSGCNPIYKCIGNGLLDSEGNAEDPPDCSEVDFARDFSFTSALPKACQPSDGGCAELDVAGNWFESYVCSSTLGQCCERVDNDNYTLNQSCKQITSSNAYNVAFSGELSGGTMQWHGSQDNPNGTAFDYSEDGTWSFSDTDNFSGSSTYTFVGGGGGECVARGRKGSLPEPVPTPAFCANLSVCGP